MDAHYNCTKCHFQIGLSTKEQKSEKWVLWWYEALRAPRRWCSSGDPKGHTFCVRNRLVTGHQYHSKFYVGTSAGRPMVERKSQSSALWEQWGLPLTLEAGSQMAGPTWMGEGNSLCLLFLGLFWRGVSDTYNRVLKRKLRSLKNHFKGNTSTEAWSQYIAKWKQ